MEMFNRKLYPYEVTMHLNGRHPYLKQTDLDFETQDVTVSITAKNWNHAEMVALSLSNLPDHWSRSVISIKRV